MEARKKYQAQNSSNIVSHDKIHPHSPDKRQRQTNTFNSSIGFNAPQPDSKEILNQQKAVRDRQFNGNPLQPGATRQSYQDSDIFGTKGSQHESVQKSSQVERNLRQRESNTFAKSNVLLNNKEMEAKDEQPVQRKAIKNRDEKRWTSEIFDGPKMNVYNRKVLSQEDAGKEGLWGNDKEINVFQKKTSLAAALSKKTERKEIIHEPAQERFMKELYGCSPVKKEVKKKDQAAPTAELSTKNRLANELQSNVLTHQDDQFRESRTAGYFKDGSSKSKMASNSGWDAQNGLSKPINAGTIIPYKMKQNQLNSNVLEQTDYSQYQPMQKKQINFDNYGRK